MRVYVPASRIDRGNAKVNIIKFWPGEVAADGAAVGGGGRAGSCGGSAVKFLQFLSLLIRDRRRRPQSSRARRSTTTPNPGCRHKQHKRQPKPTPPWRFHGGERPARRASHAPHTPARLSWVPLGFMLSHELHG